MTCRQRALGVSSTSGALLCAADGVYTMQKRVLKRMAEYGKPGPKEPGTSDYLPPISRPAQQAPPPATPPSFFPDEPTEHKPRGDSLQLGGYARALFVVAAAWLIIGSFSEIGAQSKGADSYWEETSFAALSLRAQGSQKLGTGIALLGVSIIGGKFDN
jgi:hypothetical protein